MYKLSREKNKYYKFKDCNNASLRRENRVTQIKITLLRK